MVSARFRTSSKLGLGPRAALRNSGSASGNICIKISTNPPSCLPWVALVLLSSTFAAFAAPTPDVGGMSSAIVPSGFHISGFPSSWLTAFATGLATGCETGCETGRAGFATGWGGTAMGAGATGSGGCKIRSTGKPRARNCSSGASNKELMKKASSSWQRFKIRSPMAYPTSNQSKSSTTKMEFPDPLAIWLIVTDPPLVRREKQVVLERRVVPRREYTASKLEA
mmetsp:Transcript_7496/g.15298  ORF Transcript_7496/g.15298 Transcript_7496/m.15298 type:complete len:225 (+) Transcript_7496:1201-1875(+)